MLKQTKDFVEIIIEASKIIQNNGSISDVDLMIKLDFTPPSWKVWKSKLVEKLSDYIMDNLCSENINSKVKITYNKKKKLWKSTEFIDEDN